MSSRHAEIESPSAPAATSSNSSRSRRTCFIALLIESVSPHFAPAAFVICSNRIAIARMPTMPASTWVKASRVEAVGRPLPGSGCRRAGVRQAQERVRPRAAPRPWPRPRPASRRPDDAGAAGAGAKSSAICPARGVAPLSSPHTHDYRGRLPCPATAKMVRACPAGCSRSTRSGQACLVLRGDVQIGDPCRKLRLWRSERTARAVPGPTFTPPSNGSGGNGLNGQAAVLAILASRPDAVWRSRVVERESAFVRAGLGGSATGARPRPSRSRRLWRAA